ncbi:putative dehydrogenase [Conexivisphaera calida]|uniref:Putative dehydrogenase n=1 Tax=Conexivisphaera calida TaxID=1874277 RepID=A0A4P2VPI6_9ARCH|nr:putative dehydrogenase [Conexivisphaera calida]
MKTVGLIGLEGPAAKVAERLLSAGHELVLWDKSKKIRDAFKGRADLAESTRDLAQRADILLMMLPNPNEVVEICTTSQGIYDSMKPGKIVAVLSAALPSHSAQLSEKLRRRGATFVEAPVIGGVGEIERGSAVTLVSGGRAAYQELLEVLKSFSSRVYYMGEGFSAMAAKLAVSIIAASYVEALGEATALATSAGVDMKAFAQVISSVYGDRMPFGTSVGEALEGSPKPSINLTSLITELRLAIATADERNVAIPTAGLLDSLYTAALSRGGDGDYTAIVGFVKGLSARPE